MKHGGLTLTITALGLALGISTGATDSVQAGHHSRVHAAKHHPSIARRVCYVTRHHTRTHTARRVCHSVGGYSRLTGAPKVLWGPAGMPSAPNYFGPHFDFPAHSQWRTFRGSLSGLVTKSDPRLLAIGQILSGELELQAAIGTCDQSGIALLGNSWSHADRIKGL